MTKAKITNNLTQTAMMVSFSLCCFTGSSESSLKPISRTRKTGMMISGTSWSLYSLVLCHVSCWHLAAVSKRRTNPTHQRHCSTVYFETVCNNDKLKLAYVLVNAGVFKYTYVTDGKTSL